jgi:4a-hydroxytetrahydrobiopterin dehydratase
MTESLQAKRCVPCEGGVDPATDKEIAGYLQLINGWKVIETTQTNDHGKLNKRVKTIQKRFAFKDFREAMKFLRQVEEIAEGEGHHPDFCVHYNKVDFTLFTHAIGGLHMNDFIIASKIDAIHL